jgi:hypothetical protein
MGADGGVATSDLRHRNKPPCPEEAEDGKEVAKGSGKKRLSHGVGNLQSNNLTIVRFWPSPLQEFFFFIYECTLIQCLY